MAVTRNTIVWKFEYSEDCPEGYTPIRFKVDKRDIVPKRDYRKTKLPEKGYYTIRLEELQREYINEVWCDNLETNSFVESLDIVVDCPGFRRRHLCYVKFIENNNYKTFPGENKSHKCKYLQ